MTVYQTTVILEVKATIDGEITVQQHIADYKRRHDLEVMTYTETVTDIGTVRNFVTIQPLKVNIKRSGDITMNQQFQCDRKTATLYHHPYGTFNMDIETIKLEHRPLREGQSHGEVLIDYETKIGGQEKQKHRLVLTYMEEK